MSGCPELATRKGGAASARAGTSRLQPGARRASVRTIADEEGILLFTAADLLDAGEAAVATGPVAARYADG